jgi:hypothetical protein
MLYFPPMQQKVVDFCIFRVEYIDIMEESGLQWSTMEDSWCIGGVPVGEPASLTGRTQEQGERKGKQ